MYAIRSYYDLVALGAARQWAFGQRGIDVAREGEPQVASLDEGQKFAIFDVSQITQSAPASFAEAKDAVMQAYMIDHGSAARNNFV